MIKTEQDQFNRTLFLKARAYMGWRNMGKSPKQSYDIVMCGSDWTAEQIEVFKREVNYTE
jgi:hypothetical protein